MSSRIKVIVGVVIIIFSISIAVRSSSLPVKETKFEETQIEKPGELCIDLKNQEESLEKVSLDMASQANDRQRELLRARLNQIIDGNTLTRDEDRILTDYLGYDLKDLVANTSEELGVAILRQIELKPAVTKIVNRLISNGELEPYFFNEVQILGQNGSSKYQEMLELVMANSDCFQFKAEAYKFLDESIKKVGKPGNGWFR